jgi:hypothetical protein
VDACRTLARSVEPCAITSSPTTNDWPRPSASTKPNWEPAADDRHEIDEEPEPLAAD